MSFRTEIFKKEMVLEPASRILLNVVRIYEVNVVDNSSFVGKEVDYILERLDDKIIIKPISDADKFIFFERETRQNKQTTTKKDSLPVRKDNYSSAVEDIEYEFYGFLEDIKKGELKRNIYMIVKSYKTVYSPSHIQAMQHVFAERVKKFLRENYPNKYYVIIEPSTGVIVVNVAYDKE